MAISNNLNKLTFCLLIITSLLGCNGDESTNDATMLTGQLLGSPVSGISYTTKSRTGVTDSNGNFQYQAGESIIFSLGDTLLGSTTAKEVITPFDLAGAELITEMSAIKSAIQDEQARFQAVINMTVLLQSLDQDGDPDNGIEITPEIAALFSRVSIEFQQHWQTFNENPAFINSLDLANKKKLFDKPREAKQAWSALQHLYASLGINTSIGSEDRFELDYDYDNNNIPDMVSISTYDRRGNKTSDIEDGGPSSYNENPDGRPDSILTWVYDANDNNTRYEGDYDGDGSPDYIQTRTYDASGYLTHEEWDEDGDGRPELTWTSVHDANGNNTHTESDYDGDGTTDRISTNTYDANGNLIRQETDLDVDGTIDIIETWTYDANGNNTRNEEQHRNNSALGHIETSTYDTNGNLTHTEYDEGGDGTADFIGIWSYDANGNMTRREIDYDGDGMPDKTESWSYDSHDNITSNIRDDNGDGTPDYILNSIYTHDANGNIIREERDVNGDGTTDTIVSNTYDANDNLTYTEWDTDGDGVPNETYTKGIDGWWALFHPLIAVNHDINAN